MDAEHDERPHVELGHEHSDGHRAAPEQANASHGGDDALVTAAAAFRLVLRVATRGEAGHHHLLVDDAFRWGGSGRQDAARGHGEHERRQRNSDAGHNKLRDGKPDGHCGHVHVQEAVTVNEARLEQERGQRLQVDLSNKRAPVY